MYFLQVSETGRSCEPKKRTLHRRVCSRSVVGLRGGTGSCILELSRCFTHYLSTSASALSVYVATTMSHSPFPADLLYEVIDLLRDRRNTLKSCCLVSKSWIPIARKHLFAKVEFRTWKSLQLWKAAFPDASTSPLCYVKTLLVTHYAVRLADADRIPTFPRVVNLHLNLVGAGSEVHPSPLARPESAVSLVPLHGFSPALRSLGVTFSPHPASPIFDLAYSFPLLEDLSVVTDYWFSGDDGFDRQETAVQPSDPPALTGSLELSAVGGMDPIASRLLSIPSGLKFRELKLLWNREGDILSTIELVEKCSSTLESLRIQSKLNGASAQHSHVHRWLISARRRAVGVARSLEGFKPPKSVVCLQVKPPVDC